MSLVSACHFPGTKPRRPAAQELDESDRNLDPGRHHGASYGGKYGPQYASGQEPKNDHNMSQVPVHPHCVSKPCSQCAGQEQREEENPGIEDQSQDVPSYSSPAMHTNENQGPQSECAEQGQGEKNTEPADWPPDIPSSLVPAIHRTENENPYLERARQELDDKEASKLRGRSENMLSSSGSTKHADGDEETVITSIRATDVTLGLKRLPAGFYSVVHHSGLEWKTENKRSSVNDDVVEWSGPIPIPSDPSTTVCLEVYASFEFQPMLGAGEQLRKLMVTVEQLLNHSADSVPFTLVPKDGDVVSPCSSICVTVKQRKREGGDSLTSVILDPLCSSPETQGKLEDATNRGHEALSYYRDRGGEQNLERSIEYFQRALDACPLDHPCRAVAQSNLAMATFILSQVKDSDASLDVPLSLYRNVLSARPAGHVDRPSTLIQLAAVHTIRFQRWGDEVERAQTETLLHEAIELGSTDSHENQAATFMLQLHTGRAVDPIQAEGQSSLEQSLPSRVTDEDPWTLSVQLLQRFKQSDDLVDLQRAITILEGFVRSTSVGDDRHRAGVVNLGAALWYRFDHLGQLSDLEKTISTLRDVVDLTPHDHPDRAACLSNLGSSFSTRFDHSGELDDLDEAILRYRGAVDLTPHDHTDRPTHLNNLGFSLYTRFERFGELNDLEASIPVLKEAVDLTPDSDPEKPSRLDNLGSSCSVRFERLGELKDLEDAISLQKNAVNLVPDEHPNKPRHLSNLAISLRARFERLGKLSDLEESIFTLRNAVDLTPCGHPHKPAWLNNLGNSFSVRFGRLGQLCDLEDAILTLRDAADLIPPGHPHKPIILNSLGNSLNTRFQRLGQLNDLEDAISNQREAVDLIPQSHPHKPTFLSSLGNSFKARFELLGELNDIENAISTLRRAIDLIPDGHPGRPGCLNNLGNCFKARFERLGELNDLEDAISMHKGAVHLTSHDHPDKPSRLSNLGNSFFARFERLGKLSDLEDAILMYENAVDLSPNGHTHTPGYIANLGNSLVTRFKRLGSPSDLEDAISKYRSAVDLTPRGHSSRPDYLNNLATSLRIRFERVGEMSDLTDAISMLNDAVGLTPRSHHHHTGYLNNLGTSLFTRFERLGELNDLEDAISRLRGAVDLTPDGHPDKLIRLDSLGISLKARFDRLGELGDLEDAILRHRSAADLTPHGHPGKPTCLSNLGSSLVARFYRLGELSDLEEAILRHRDAADLTLDGHPDKLIHLNNVGSSFLTRFHHLSELSDLEDAISTLRDTNDLIPHSHSHKPILLNNLGNSFTARFNRLKEPSDIEQAISIYKDAVDLVPDGHPDKPIRLNSLGNAFFARFEHFMDLDDLEEAISRYSDAVNLTPYGHPNKPSHLNNLGSSFFTRFKRLGELSDLEEAILRQKDAADLTPRGHPQKPALLNNLATSIFAHFERVGEPRSLQQAISLYSDAASSLVGSIRDRFQASLKWITCAQRARHHSLLHAYSASIGLLPQLAWIGLSLTNRYSELTRGADVVREAAAAALESGLPETAVEWLEQGRSIVWGELFQLRNSYEELASVHSDHARRLREISIALERASASREKHLSAILEQSQNAAHRATESLKQEADRHRKLAIERDKLLQEIRRLPGFERFLLHKRFSQLHTSAHPGPVVILNAAKSRCDALIVLDNVDHVIHVPLPNFTVKRSADLQNTLKTFVRDAHPIRLDERDGQSAPWDFSWESALSPLWKCVVRPVLDALAFSSPGDLSRIFWCPTGPFTFLPIHAAGFYDGQYSPGGNKVSDFVVSSYVPTLAILAPSPGPATRPSDDLRLLTVRQPSSDGLPQLPGVDTELEYINELIRNSPSAHATLLETTLGTVEEVLDLMKEADWVHFACHGVQDAIDSGLCLADRRRLKVRDIIALTRPHGGLAFLSACQTAKGDERLSDEAIHIAAGMLLAGYGGVVGTMWSISDRLAPGVARDVYKQLFRTGKKPDYREAAWALHDAVGRLRDSGASFDEWVPFIHVGL